MSEKDFPHWLRDEVNAGRIRKAAARTARDLWEQFMFEQADAAVPGFLDKYLDAAKQRKPVTPVRPPGDPRGSNETD